MIAVKAINKPQIVKIEAELKGFTSTVKNYIKFRDEELGKLAIKDARRLINLIREDYKGIIYVDSLKKKGGSK